jgi:hypothetical protein
MTECERYKYGCTCGPCHERYIKRHAHSCTYGVDPRLQDGKLYGRGYDCCGQGCSRCKREEHGSSHT